MIDAVLTVLALLAGGLTLEAYAAARAPLGSQDEYGFQTGPEAHEHAKARPSENPS